MVLVFIFVSFLAGVPLESRGRIGRLPMQSSSGTGCSEAEAGVGAGHVGEKLLGVFADERFLVVAGHVVPADPVLVDVVQDGQAGLVGAVYVELRVVRLPDLLVSRLGPRVEGPALGDLVSRRHLLPVGGPEPPVERLGLEVASVFAALEVADAAGRPDVGDIVWTECGLFAGGNGFSFFECNRADTRYTFILVHSVRFDGQP